MPRALPSAYSSHVAGSGASARPPTPRAAVGVDLTIWSPAMPYAEGGPRRMGFVFFLPAPSSFQRKMTAI